MEKIEKNRLTGITLSGYSGRMAEHAEPGAELLKVLQG